MPASTAQSSAGDGAAYLEEFNLKAVLAELTAALLVLQPEDPFQLMMDRVSDFKCQFEKFGRDGMCFEHQEPASQMRPVHNAEVSRVTARRRSSAGTPHPRATSQLERSSSPFLGSPPRAVSAMDSPPRRGRRSLSPQTSSQFWERVDGGNHERKILPSIAASQAPAHAVSAAPAVSDPVLPVVCLSTDKAPGPEEMASLSQLAGVAVSSDTYSLSSWDCYREGRDTSKQNHHVVLLVPHGFANDSVVAQLAQATVQYLGRVHSNNISHCLGVRHMCVTLDVRKMNEQLVQENSGKLEREMHARAVVEGRLGASVALAERRQRQSIRRQHYELAAAERKRRAALREREEMEEQKVRESEELKRKVEQEREDLKKALEVERQQNEQLRKLAVGGEEEVKIHQKARRKLEEEHAAISEALHKERQQQAEEKMKLEQQHATEKKELADALAKSSEKTEELFRSHQERTDMDAAEKKRLEEEAATLRRQRSGLAREHREALEAAKRVEDEKARLASELARERDRERERERERAETPKVIEKVVTDTAEVERMKAALDAEHQEKEELARRLRAEEERQKYQDAARERLLAMKPTIGITTAESGKIAGAVVSKVKQNSAAAIAGIRKGDVVTRVGSIVLKDGAHFAHVLHAAFPGETETFHVDRKGIVHEIAVQFGGEGVTLEALNGLRATAGAEWCKQRDDEIEVVTEQDKRVLKVIADNKKFRSPSRTSANPKN